MARSNPKAKRPRAPERDYSHRSLLDKLGIQAGQKIAVLGINDRPFLNGLKSRVPDFASATPSSRTGIVLFAAEAIADLARLKSLINAIERNGAIWVVYPKGQSHICEVDVIAAGKAVGLVDNKVCRFSDTHTALRFVIPLAKR